MGKIVRTITADGTAMMCAIDSTSIAAQAEQYHKTSAVVTAALGRLLTAASMMGAMLKGEGDSLTLRLSGGGPTGLLTAVSDSRGNVRGYASQPVVELPLNNKGKLDVAGAVGRQGSLTVIRDLGLKEPYIGQVPLVSGEIAEDITSYYAVSEQIPTVCGLGVLVNPDLSVKSAGGFLLQLLPGADDSMIDRLEENVSKLPPVSSMIGRGMSPEEICMAALDGFQPEVLDQFNADYLCPCTRERTEKVLIALGRQELAEMIAEGSPVNVECHFCDRQYSFTTSQLKSLLDACTR